MGRVKQHNKKTNRGSSPPLRKRSFHPFELPYWVELAPVYKGYHNCIYPVIFSEARIENGKTQYWGHITCYVKEESSCDWYNDNVIHSTLYHANHDEEMIVGSTVLYKRYLERDEKALSYIKARITKINHDRYTVRYNDGKGVQRTIVNVDRIIPWTI